MAKHLDVAQRGFGQRTADEDEAGIFGFIPGKEAAAFHARRLVKQRQGLADFEDAHYFADSRVSVDDGLAGSVGVFEGLEAAVGKTKKTEIGEDD